MTNFVEAAEKERILVFDQQVSVWKKTYGDSVSWLNDVASRVERELKRGRVPTSLPLQKVSYVPESQSRGNGGQQTGYTPIRKANTASAMKPPPAKAAIVNENVTATPALDQLRDVVAKQKVEGSVRKLKTPAVGGTGRKRGAAAAVDAVSATPFQPRQTRGSIRRETDAQKSDVIENEKAAKAEDPAPEPKKPKKELEKEAMEKKRIEEEEAEKKRLEEEEKKKKEEEEAEAKRQDEMKKEEAKRLAAEAKEAKRKEKATKKAKEEEEKRQAELQKQKQIEEERIAKELEEKRKIEEVEKARIAKEAEEKRKAEEAKRIAKEQEVERIRVEKQKAADEKRKLEEAKKLADEKAAKEKAAEEERIAKAKAAEEARIAKEKAAEEARLVKEKAAEEARLAKEKAAEEERELTKKAEEAALIAAQKRAEENAARERQREEERARQEEMENNLLRKIQDDVGNVRSPTLSKIESRLNLADAESDVRPAKANSVKAAAAKINNKTKEAAVIAATPIARRLRGRVALKKGEDHGKTVVEEVEEPQQEPEEPSKIAPMYLDQEVEEPAKEEQPAEEEGPKRRGGKKKAAPPKELPSRALRNKKTQEEKPEEKEVGEKAQPQEEEAPKKGGRKGRQPRGRNAKKVEEIEEEQEPAAPVEPSPSRGLKRALEEEEPTGETKQPVTQPEEQPAEASPERSNKKRRSEKDADVSTAAKPVEAPVVTLATPEMQPLMIVNVHPEVAVIMPTPVKAPAPKLSQEAVPIAPAPATTPSAPIADQSAAEDAEKAAQNHRERLKQQAEEKRRLQREERERRRLAEAAMASSAPPPVSSVAPLSSSSDLTAHMSTVQSTSSAEAAFNAALTRSSSFETMFIATSSEISGRLEKPNIPAPVPETPPHLRTAKESLISFLAKSEENSDHDEFVTAKHVLVTPPRHYAAERKSPSPSNLMNRIAPSEKTFLDDDTIRIDAPFLSPSANIEPQHLHQMEANEEHIEQPNFDAMVVDKEQQPTFSFDEKDNEDLEEGEVKDDDEEEEESMKLTDLASQAEEIKSDMGWKEASGTAATIQNGSSAAAIQPPLAQSLIPKPKLTTSTVVITTAPKSTSTAPVSKIPAPSTASSTAPSAASKDAANTLSIEERLLRAQQNRERLEAKRLQALQEKKSKLEEAEKRREQKLEQIRLKRQAQGPAGAVPTSAAPSVAPAAPAPVAAPIAASAVAPPAAPAKTSPGDSKKRPLAANSEQNDQKRIKLNTAVVKPVGGPAFSSTQGISAVSTMSSLPKASEKLEPSLNEKKLSEKKPMQVINLESSDADFDVTPSSSPFPGTHSSKDIVEEKEKDEIDRKLMPPPKIPPVNRVKEGTPKSVRSSPDRIQGASQFYRTTTPQERFSLSSPVISRSPARAVTPTREQVLNLPTLNFGSPKRAEPEKSVPSSPADSGEEAIITDYYFDSDPESSGDESEKEQKEKKMKKWARSEKLELALRKQSNVDPDPIFAGIQQRTVDLAAVFGRVRSHYQRSDRLSGNWQQDAVTEQEDAHYKKRMGWR